MSSLSVKSIVVGLMLLAFSTTSQAALSQSVLQTPEGRQTVAPSDMPQQPSASEEFGNPNTTGENVTPPTSIDQPGIPGIAVPKPTISGAAKPGLRNAPGEQIPTEPGQPKTMAPTAPGAQPSPGDIILPPGVPSSVRIGPVEPIPLANRIALTAAILLQLMLVIIVAFAIQRQHNYHSIRYQGGKDINEDYREGWLEKKGHAARDF